MPTYTAEIAGQPNVVFIAGDDGGALAFATDEFILSELKNQVTTPEGAPLWDGQTEVTVRLATPDEVAVWERDLAGDVADGVYESLDHALSGNRFEFLVDYREVYE